MLADATGATVYLTLIAYGSEFVAWNTGQKGTFKSYVGSSGCTILGTLAGTDRYQRIFADTKGKNTYTDQVMAFGTVNGTEVIIKLKIIQETKQVPL